MSQLYVESWRKFTNSANLHSGEIREHCSHVGIHRGQRYTERVYKVYAIVEYLGSRVIKSLKGKIVEWMNIYMHLTHFLFPKYISGLIELKMKNVLQNKLLSSNSFDLLENINRYHNSAFVCVRHFNSPRTFFVPYVLYVCTYFGPKSYYIDRRYQNVIKKFSVISV